MFDVAIVGFGPTGAIAAGLLGLQGIRTFVCDEQTEVYDKPRAIALDHEIMRVFQQLGIAQAIEPFMEPFTNSEFYGVDGQLAIFHNSFVMLPCNELGMPTHHIPKPSHTKDFLTLMMEKLKSNTTMI